MIRLAAAFVVSIAVAQPAWADIARVKSATGAAHVQRQKARLPVSPGFAVRQGDWLVTGKTGRMALTFIDNTRFSVGPGSRVSVDEFLYNRRTRRGRFVTRVNRGSLAVVSGQIAKSERDAMKLRTPTTLLGVRGTRFVVEVP